METTPHPNLIIPLQLSDPASVRKASESSGSCVTRWPRSSCLIDLMPGNDDGVITPEEQP